MSGLPEECARLYTVVRQLGEGGFGSVWLAVHRTLGREVALKVLHASVVEQEQRARFLEEARITAMLSDPHIVKVLDHGSGDVPWIAYEYLPGRSVRDLLDSGPLPWRQALSVADQVAAALEAAHEARIVHRDIKAENVLEASPGHYKVADFGIARWVGSEVKTRTGFIMGTPTHLAPEVWQGGTPDEASDVYALGILLYELLVGQLPFDGDNLGEILKAHLERPPATPGRFQADVPAAVSELVKTALAKDRSMRFGSASQLRSAIRRALGGEAAPAPAPASRSGAISRSPRSTTQRVALERSKSRPTASLPVVPADARPARRSPLAIALAALAAGGAVALAVAWGARTSPPPPPPTPAPSRSASPSRVPSPSLAALPKIRERLLHAMHRRYAAYRIARAPALPLPDPSAPEQLRLTNLDVTKPVVAESIALLADALVEARELPDGPHWAVAAVIALETLRALNLVPAGERDPATVTALRRMTLVAKGNHADPFRAMFARTLTSRLASLMEPGEKASKATAEAVRAAVHELAVLKPAAWTGTPLDRPFVMLRLTLVEAAIRESLEKRMGINVTPTGGLGHAWNRSIVLGDELVAVLTSNPAPGPLEDQSRDALIETLLVAQKLAGHFPGRARSDYAPFVTGAWRCLHLRAGDAARNEWAGKRGAEIEEEFAKHGVELRLEPRPRPSRQ